MKKRILPILAGLWPYLLVGTFLMFMWFTPDVLASVNPVLILFGMVLLGPALGTVFLLLDLKSRMLSPVLLAKWNLTAKLIHIPFYIVMFLLGFLVAPLAAPFFFILDVMALCTSSGIGIAAILRARREDGASTGWALLHIALHCFFVTDVLSAFLVRKRLRTAVYSCN